MKSFGVQSMDVPEWGENGAALRLTWHIPPQLVLGKAMKEAGGDVVEYSARLVAMCARDGAGKRLFSDLDYRELMRSCHPAVVGRIGTAIAMSARLDLSEKAGAEAEGN